MVSYHIWPSPRTAGPPGDDASAHCDDAALRVLACTKNNLAAFPPALAFRLAATSAAVPSIDWQGAVDRTADDLVAAGQRRGEAVPRGVTFLQQHLARGPCNRQTLLEEAQRQGISLRTLERAKAELGVRSEQRREEGRNVWYWALAAA